jgi:hypothetical protein
MSSEDTNPLGRHGTRYETRTEVPHDRRTPVDFGSTTGVKVGNQPFRSQETGSGSNLAPGKSSTYPGKSAFRRLDSGLLKKALRLLQESRAAQEIDYGIARASLRGVLADLWHSAADASSGHQDLLAIIELAVSSTYRPAPAVVELMLEGLRDLEGESIAAAHLELLRRRLAENGHNSLAGIDFGAFDESNEE